VSTSTASSGCFQPGQAKVVLGPTPLDKTVQRVGREIGGARKQRVLQTGQLETRICKARESGGPEWRLRACWLCTFLAGGVRVRACGEGSCRFPCGKVGSKITRICTAREKGGPACRPRAWVCTFLAGGGRVRSCGEGSSRIPPPPSGDSSVSRGVECSWLSQPQIGSHTCS
jgi:hypothetical protein